MEIGTRVRVKQVLAENYIQPFRKWIQERRLATVVSLCGEPHDLSARLTIEFDCARKPKRPLDYALPNLWVADLEVARDA